MAIIKIYTSPEALTKSQHQAPDERCEIIEKAYNVTVHQGTYILPHASDTDMPQMVELADGPNSVANVLGVVENWGPYPLPQAIHFHGAAWGDPVKVVDYTEECGVRVRALVKNVAYVMSEETGITIERAEVIGNQKMLRAGKGRAA